MTKPIHAILIGAGNRGAESYAPFALQHPDQLKYVAVAEPNETRRKAFAEQHQIPEENQFESWEPLLEKPALGEVAFISTQDWQHTAPAVAAMRAGYHIMLEKPMANKMDECRLLLDVSQELNARCVFVMCCATRHISERCGNWYNPGCWGRSCRWIIVRMFPSGIWHTRMYAATGVIGSSPAR